MELKNFKHLDKGCLKASFRVYRDVYGKGGEHLGTEWFDCSYFEKNESAWINPCSKMYEARDGTRKSYNMIGWDNELTRQLTAAIREKIKNRDYREGPVEQAPAKNFDELPF